MADESGSNPPPDKARPSTSLSLKPHQEAQPQRLNLLLAEDNLADALLVREAIRLENLPVEVYAAPDGERAIEFFENTAKDPQAPCPHVLLLDLNLPKLDGFEVLRRVRSYERFRNIPVVIITSSDSPVDRVEGATLDAGYFRKPPNYTEFMKLGPYIKNFLEENNLL